ncbi:MAG: B12-binding domain-containing radical SAM protein, partial [Thiothrix sp.]|nr:B12-binding domain-containing radical SAM protein [Thiothrix sp.]
MPRLLLSTLNARYSHASLGLRYLYANLGEIQPLAAIQEFTISMRALDIAEQLLAEKPDIIGFGVYIWNAQETLQVVEVLKTLAPECIIILGGPEVSYETEVQPLTALADYVITGPGETSLYRLCTELLAGRQPQQRMIAGETVALAQLNFPYAFYTAHDIRHRVIYVEASRGCPFKCEFCLSALDKTAYPFELEAFLEQMEQLWQRGLRQFKFVDRTFNLKITTTLKILDFFLERLDQATFLHFELIPDHLPEVLRERIRRFPPGSLQFEIGIQTFNPNVQSLISRRQDHAKTVANLHWLREETQVHLHTDLIFGLPGEDLDSFAQGFDQLVRLRPHEIQLGILKRLRGTPIIRHTEAFGMCYNPRPPYNILRTDRIDFNTLQQMNRFARYWDLIGNSGRFEQTLPLLLENSPFQRFRALSLWLYQQTGQTHKIALPRLFQLVHQAGIEQLGLEAGKLTRAMTADYSLTGQKGPIPFTNPASSQPAQARPETPATASPLPSRPSSQPRN